VKFDAGIDIASAVALARASQLAIVFAVQNASEGEDLPNLSLSDNQDALIEAVATANPHTIVVLETGGPVTMPWIGKVGAVLEAWFPGIRGSEAIANILSATSTRRASCRSRFPAAKRICRIQAEPPAGAGCGSISRDCIRAVALRSR